MTFKRRSLAILGLITILSIHALAGGLRHTSARKTTISGRMLARVPNERVTSIGLNYETYIIEITSKNENGRSLIKLSYRFDLRDPKIPKSLFDYSLVHKFRVTRDEACDESWGSISSRIFFDRNGAFIGKENALEYAANSQPVDADADLTLPCYAAVPQDYQSTVKASNREPKTGSSEPNNAKRKLPNSSETALQVAKVE